MNIMKLLAAKAKDNRNTRLVTIAFPGDSVTRGCFEIYRKSETKIDTVFDKNNAYHADVAKIPAVLFPSVPVNIVNAGISGDNAPHGPEWMEQDVLRYNPDLTVVCYSLNDCDGEVQQVGRYTHALGEIFEKLRHRQGVDVTELLANKINHPTREMNWLFAVSPVDTMLRV